MTAKNMIAKRAISNLQVEPNKFLPTTKFLNEFLPDETKKIKLTFDVPVYLFAEGRKLPVTVNLIKVKGEVEEVLGSSSPSPLRRSALATRSSSRSRLSA